MFATAFCVSALVQECADAYVDAQVRPYPHSLYSHASNSDTFPLLLRRRRGESVNLAPSAVHTPRALCCPRASPCFDTILDIHPAFSWPSPAAPASWRSPRPASTRRGGPTSASTASPAAPPPRAAGNARAHRGSARRAPRWGVGLRFVSVGILRENIFTL